jgi:predicted transcriptional regulator
MKPTDAEVMILRVLWERGQATVREVHEVLEANGERISTGFVESAVNQVISKRFVKKQQMRWTPKGAHLLLQTRTKVLNGDLEAMFRTHYPGFRKTTLETPRVMA